MLGPQDAAMAAAEAAAQAAAQAQAQQDRHELEKLDKLDRHDMLQKQDAAAPLATSDYVHPKTGQPLKDSGNWVLLCGRCSDFCHSRDFQRVLRREAEEARYLNSLQHLATWADDCLLCRQLLERYQHPSHENQYLSQTARAALTRCKTEIVDGIEVRVHAWQAWDRKRRSALVFAMRALESGHDWLYCISSVFWMFTAADNHAAKYFPGRDIDTDVSSDSSWNQALAWVTKCIQGHANCGPYVAQPLPARVVDVTGDDARLHCADDGRLEHYAALSYCWGADQPLKTTTANVADYAQRLPLDRLPRTIQDAVTTTRKLGLKYLWVDALCIVQDDEADRKRQLAAMRDIFTHSAVTIIAASASTAEAGFLAKRPEPLPVSLRLPFLCPNGMMGTVMLRNDSWYQYDPQADATEQRAWCLEESLLPRRTLIYTATHLRWRCQTIEDCHGGHLHNRLRGESTRLATRPQRETDNAVTSVTEDDEDDDDRLWDSWQDVLLDYTRRQLTHPRDKLVAIAGLADEFQRATGDRYLAGLWESRLAEDLLWDHPYDNPQLRPRPAAYRAPSWSWASVDSAVRRFRGESSETRYFELLDYSVTPLSRDAPLGQVVGGRLIVRSRVRLAVWDPQNSDVYELGEGSGGGGEDDDDDDDDDNDDDGDNNIFDATERLLAPLAPDWQERAVPVGQAEPDADEPASRQPGYVLCLSVGTQTGVDDGQEGLVLVRALDVVDEVVYRRVACFELPEGDDWFEDAQREDIVII